MKHQLIELEQRLLDGLPVENQVWGRMFRQLDYLEMKNAQYIKQRPHEACEDFEGRPKVISRITHQVLNELSKDLYGPGPYRSVRNPAADAFYQAVLSKNNANAKLQRADTLSQLHGLFAIQIDPSDDPDKPLKLYPWQATEIFVYAADDDPSDIWAVLTRSVFPMRRQVRYQIWSDAEVRTYWTRPGDVEPIPRGTGRQLEWDEAASGQHGFGVLPFVFFHARVPITSVYEGALGEGLTCLNHTLDEKLSDMAQAIQQYANPRMYAIGVNPSSSFSNIPGSPTHLTADSTTGSPDIFFRQPSLNVEQSWLDINNLIDRALAEMDIPLAAKMDQSTPESGVAGIVRRLSLLNRTLARQPQWIGYEQELARKILVIGKKIGPGDAVDVEVSFPPPTLPLPTPDRDNADKFMLDLGLKSRIGLLMERYGLTRTEAMAKFKELADDKRLEEQLAA